MSLPLPTDLIATTNEPLPGLYFVLARRKRWISLFLVIGLGIIMAEGLLRTLDPQLYRYVHHRQILHLYQSDGPARLHPGRDLTFHLDRNDGSTLYRFSLHTDQYGLRVRNAEGADRSLSYLGRPREIVHCLGDGLTLGWGVDYEDAWPSILEGRLGRTRHVMNFSADGHGLIGAIQNSDRVSDGFPPDIVIWAVGPNDFADDEHALRIADRMAIEHWFRRGILKLQRSSYLLSSPRVWSTRQRLSKIRAISSIAFRPSPHMMTREAILESARTLMMGDPPVTLRVLLEYHQRLSEQGRQFHVLITDGSETSLTVLRWCLDHDIPVTVEPIGPEGRLPADVYFNELGARRVGDAIFNDLFSLSR